MGKPTGFLNIPREKLPLRPTHVRRQDYQEVYEPVEDALVQRQGARCMDCGVPFCHQGCPLGNVIPDWNDQVYRGDFAAALQRLHATNNFPEFTGRLCPAPCEAACVLSINAEPVAIKAVELGIIEHAFKHHLLTPTPRAPPTRKRVAVVGSGPAGLAAAEQLHSAGHAVTVFERADRLGGLLRYGIPDFKMEKHVLERRLQRMRDAGIQFHTHAHVGENLAWTTVQQEHHAVLLAGGATQARDIAVTGRSLMGVHWAMDYLTQQNRRVAGDAVASSEAIDARDKVVVILGEGDTGADCLGTAHRQGARQVYQIEINPRPPDQRHANNPWPEWPQVYRIAPAHEEGGQRLYAINTLEFFGEGRVAGLRGKQLDSDETLTLPCDLVLIAAGFTGPETPLLDALQMQRTPRGTVWRDENWCTSVPGVFTAGDMQRGQSLIVWAIADGRSAARGIDRYLMGSSQLPAPL